MGGCVSTAALPTRNGSNITDSIINTMPIVTRHRLWLSGSKTMGFVV
jgi:hypothetical protein